LNATSALAAAYMQAGRRKEAADLIEWVYPRYVEVLGPRHPDTLIGAANLASVYRQSGRIDRAAELLGKVLPVSREVHGESHPETLVAQSVLAISYTDIGRGEDAARLLEHVVRVRRKDLGPDHPKTVIAASNLALAIERAGRADAVSPLEDVLPACVARLGPADWTSLTLVVRLFDANGAPLAGPGDFDSLVDPDPYDGRHYDLAGPRVGVDLLGGVTAAWRDVTTVDPAAPNPGTTTVVLNERRWRFPPGNPPVLTPIQPGPSPS
jgi:tetratricopeptide (TPR) repeat protein